MGYLMEVRCDGCDINSIEATGVGMSGVSRELFACMSCGSVVTVEQENAFDALPNLEPERPHCPACHSEVVPIADGDPCPCGSGTLRVARVGLWD